MDRACILAPDFSRVIAEQAGLERGVVSQPIKIALADADLLHPRLDAGDPGDLLHCNNQRLGGCLFAGACGS